MRMNWLTALAGTVLAVAISSGCFPEGSESYSFVVAWPSEKVSSYVEFRYPTGIAVDSSGNVYVADPMNVPIQKFDSSGKLLAKWDSYGSDDGEFIEACAVAADSKGNVFVVDSGNDRIQKLDSSGKFLWKCGEKGYHEGQFDRPCGISLDASGNIFVLDSEREKVLTFDASGKFVMEWGSSGSGEGQFDTPYGIAVDAEGSVFIADSDNERIQKYDSQGKFLMQWGKGGSGEGEFFSPEGIAVDSKSNVFVVDLNATIQKFDSSGKFLTKWGSRGSSEGYMIEPSGIAVGSSGNVYVADTGNKRVQKFRPPAGEASVVQPEEKVPEEETKGPVRHVRKLTLENVFSLRALDISDEDILRQIVDSDTIFAPEEIEKLKRAGFGDEFIAKLPKSEEPKHERKKLTVENVVLLKELGIEEGTILKKVQDSGTVFSVEEVEKLRQAGLTDETIAKLPKAGKRKPKLTADNVILLHDVGLSDEEILNKIEETGSTFSSEEAERFRSAGLTDDFVAKLLATEVRREKKEEKREEKKEKVEPREKGLAGSWKFKGTGVEISLVLGEDGSFSWHYESGEEVEHLKGTWKQRDDETLEIKGQNTPLRTLIPCKLVDAETLQISVGGMSLQLKREN